MGDDHRMSLAKRRLRLVVLTASAAMAGASAPADGAITKLVPAAGPARSSVALEGHGFHGHERVPVRSGGRMLAVARANSRGRIRARFTISGSGLVRVTVGTARRSTTHHFVVTSVQPEHVTSEVSSSRRASVRWSPPAEVAGRPLRIRARGLPRRTRTRVVLGGRVLARRPTSGRGRLDLRVALPDVSPGRRQIRISAGTTALAFPIEIRPYPRVAAAGDIACDPGSANFAGGTNSCHMRETAALLHDRLAAVLPLGDLQYEDGALEKFHASYAPTWGRRFDITRPAVGNHEYLTPGAAGYFAYFGARAGDADRGYYSFDVGAWHLVAINSNCSKVGGCGGDSPQTRWLRADLARHRTTCTLAYWHHPRFSSGQHGSYAAMEAIWQVLYDAGADVVLSGHDHYYERFAGQTAAGALDHARGIRQFVVGTGGRNLTRSRGGPAPNSEIRDSSTFGVLELTLRPTSYGWRFVGEPGSLFSDVGGQPCH